MSFIEELFTRELTVLEYKQIIAHCQEQLSRLLRDLENCKNMEEHQDVYNKWEQIHTKKKFTEKDLHELLRPLREALSPSEEYESEECYCETRKFCREDRD